MKSEISWFSRKAQARKALRHHRQAGDEARDCKDWASAEREYAAHLALFPDDQPIWIQYGHALKEQGNVSTAEAAYRRAIEQRPDDADAHLQLGHALKVLGQTEDARESYLASLDLRPSKAAFDEVSGAGLAADQLAHASAAAADVGADTIYLEIDDLLDYLRNYRTVSGIQRVQVGIVQHVIAGLTAGYCDLTFVRTGKPASGFWRLDAGDLARIVDYIKQASVSQPRLLGLIQAAEQNATLVTPTRGQTYFVLGAFWGFGANASRYATLKRAGVRIGVYIYDLIPITHPEYCSAGLVSEFSFALGDGLHVFDFILTISEYVAADVRRFLSKNGLAPIPVDAVPLAHRIHDAPVKVTPRLEMASWKGALASVRGKHFVLVVGTIEPRKNHAYLYSVWKMMIEEGLEPPDLVFVGRFGWRVNDLRDMLEGTGYLGGRIHVLHDISDVDLELLYHACLFTAFPSIAEGWGLPVGESLAHGRPSIASNISSIPEVGGAFVDYIDPWNVRDGVKVFKRMILDEAYRARRARDIQDNFTARTWDDVSRDLLEHLAAHQGTPLAPYIPPVLAPGELFVPGNMVPGQTAPDNYASRPLRPILASGWYPAEPFGSWMRGNEGSVQFSTGCKPGTRVTAYLHLVGAPWSVSHMVTLYIGQTGTAWMPAPGSTSFPILARSEHETFRITTANGFFCRVSGMVEQDGTVQMHFLVKGETVGPHSAKPAEDDRVFYMGLIRLAYAPAADAELRADLFEKFLATV